MSPANINDRVLGGQKFLQCEGTASAQLSNIKDVAVQVGVGIDAMDLNPNTGLVGLDFSYLLLWTMDKQDFLNKLAFEDSSASDNVDLAGITLTSTDTTFTYRSIAAAAQDLAPVNLQQSNFLKVHRFSKDATGGISGANVMAGAANGKTVGGAADMKSALNAQVCQLQGMVATHDNAEDGVPQLKTLIEGGGAGGEAAVQLAIEQLRAIGIADGGGLGPPVDEIERSYGNVLTPALTMIMSVGDYKTAVLSPSGGSTADTNQTHTKTLYYNVRLVNDGGVELAARFQTDIEKKFDQIQQVRIFARWVHSGPIMPDKSDGRTDASAFWPANPSAHKAVGNGNQGVEFGPDSGVVDDTIGDESNDILSAISNPLYRIYGRLEWADEPSVSQVVLSKDKVNNLVKGLVDVKQDGDKATQLAEIKAAVLDAIVRAEFKGVCSEAGSAFEVPLSANVNLMGYNDGPSGGVHVGGTAAERGYAQVFQTCVAFTDAHGSLS